MKIKEDVCTNRTVACEFAICPSKDFPPRGEKICPRNLGVWLYTCCGDEFNECCGTISNFGWLIIGIIGAAAVATLAAVIVNNVRKHRNK